MLFSKRPRTHRSRRQRTHRVEALESRRLLTSYLVDTIVDNPAALIGDGAISLREAINAASSNAPFGDAPAGQGGGVVDTISFDASLNGQTIVLGGEELVVSDQLSVIGLGQDDLTISGNDASPIFMVKSDVILDLSELTLTGGAGYEGGGIYNEGTLNMANSALINNSASYQGGAVFNAGTFNLVNGTFSGNESGTQGGAIKNGADGKLTIADSTFSENTAGSSGGAIDSFYGFVAATGWLDITNTTFDSNSGSNGGAIYNWLPAQISESTFVGNSARSTGGAFANRFANSSYLTTIVNSSFTNNDAGLYGGAIDNTGATMEIENSTLNDNFAGREGGAIENYFGNLTVTNSTISGNSTDRTGGGIWNLGTLKLTSSTLVANRADADGNAVGDGGGIYDDGSSSPPVIHNTIVGGNLLGALLAEAASDIVGSMDGSSSHNLIGDAATAGGLTDATNGNIVGSAGVGTLDITNVLDLTLADNGGASLTHALLPNGLAVNAGENTLAVDADGKPLENDQRGDGFDRIVDVTVDIGSFELPPQAQIIEIDVKPDSDPNSINLANNGVIAVSILTTDDFDAASVDANTVQFANARAVHHSLEDVDGDGDLDMVLHFRVQDTNLAEIYADLLSEGSESNHQSFAVALTGATLGGTSFTGSDGVDMFFSGKALRDLLNELALTGVL